MTMNNPSSYGLFLKRLFLVFGLLALEDVFSSSTYSRARRGSTILLGRIKPYIGDRQNGNNDDDDMIDSNDQNHRWHDYLSGIHSIYSIKSVASKKSQNKLKKTTISSHQRWFSITSSNKRTKQQTDNQLSLLWTKVQQKGQTKLMQFKKLGSDIWFDNVQPIGEDVWIKFSQGKIGLRHQLKQVKSHATDIISMPPAGGGGEGAMERSFWESCRHRGGIGLRHFKHISSEVLFNMPPAGQSLILLTMLPTRQKVLTRSGEVVKRKVIPLLSNAFARKLVAGYIGISIISWSYDEICRKRQLTPLPLLEEHREIKKAILPPFLPEDIPISRDKENVIANELGKNEEIQRKIENKEEVLRTSPFESSIQAEIEEAERDRTPNKFLIAVFNGAKKRKDELIISYNKWRKDQESKRIDDAISLRLETYDELVSLQKSLSKKKRRDKKHRRNQESDDGGPMGYALITGASRGIGRAIAVELARWDIDLILVARDIDRLKSLASDIESCYGVQVCILQADLSKADSAVNIHKATTNAGLDVDLLVNNAGICTSGSMVDMSTEDIQSMIQVNTMSFTALNHLYGIDMKHKRRGRILVVSSVTGSVEAGPNVATYAATKRYEKALALAMSKELEPYGVGVTCLMPGAVGGTAFRSSSGSNKALCWNVPGYAMSPDYVASSGVRAMLAGDIECIPGWHNRAFVRVICPMIPQRLSTKIVEMAWSPLHLPWKQQQEAQSTNNGTNTLTNRKKLKNPKRLLRIPPAKSENAGNAPPTTTGQNYDEEVQLIFPDNEENSDTTSQNNVETRQNVFQELNSTEDMSLDNFAIDEDESAEVPSLISDNVSATVSGGDISAAKLHTAYEEDVNILKEMEQPHDVAEMIETLKEEEDEEDQQQEPEEEDQQNDIVKESEAATDLSVLLPAHNAAAMEKERISLAPPEEQVKEDGNKEKNQIISFFSSVLDGNKRGNKKTTESALAQVNNEKESDTASHQEEKEEREEGISKEGEKASESDDCVNSTESNDESYDLLMKVLNSGFRVEPVQYDDDDDKKFSNYHYSLEHGDLVLVDKPKSIVSSSSSSSSSSNNNIDDEKSICNDNGNRDNSVMVKNDNNVNFDDETATRTRIESPGEPLKQRNEKNVVQNEAIEDNGAASFYENNVDQHNEQHEEPIDLLLRIL